MSEGYVPARGDPCVRVALDGVPGADGDATSRRLVDSFMRAAERATALVPFRRDLDGGQDASIASVVSAGILLGLKRIGNQGLPLNPRREQAPSLVRAEPRASLVAAASDAAAADPGFQVSFCFSFGLAG